MSYKRALWVGVIVVVLFVGGFFAQDLMVPGSPVASLNHGGHHVEVDEKPSPGSGRRDAEVTADNRSWGTKVREALSGFSDLLPTGTCSVRGDVVDLTMEWNPINEGAKCLVVYELGTNSMGQARDFSGRFPLIREEGKVQNRIPESVRGVGKLKYSLCDKYLDGQLLNLACSVRTASK